LGVVDLFEDRGLAIFGPSKEAARLESSKSFAKQVMESGDVPTAKAARFAVYEDASRYVQSCPLPTVVKADGLASGKGVIIAQTRFEAQDAVRRVMHEREFGAAGDCVLIEEFLEGPEVSVFAFVNGNWVSPVVSACDYKRACDGDTGPNTGGMGAYSPPRFWTASLETEVRSRILEPVARVMSSRGTPYKGVLYAGLMLTEDGPKVIEFNCRLGDPETQVVLPRLKSDLAKVMIEVAQNRVSDVTIEWDDRCCVGVVLASGGYPGKYATGFPIDGLDSVDGDVQVFHAGTRRDGNTVSTGGGRVLTVSACGNSIEEARSRAYENAGRIRFEGSQFRRDVALLV
jgi:phosphoribosylamine--glycine ligase